jgi:diguanylate cyclase (GGDEF)-like protein
MKNSLRTKILVLVAASIAVTAALTLAGLAILAQRQIDRMVRGDVRATGAILAGQITDRTDTLTQQCRLLADLPVLKGAIGTDDPATVADIAHDVVHQVQADGVMMSDVRPRRLASIGAVQMEPNIAGDPGVVAALGGREWSGVRTYDGDLVIAVTVPVLKDGTVFGTFTAYKRIDSRMAQTLSDALGTDVAFVVDGRAVGASRGIASDLLGDPRRAGSTSSLPNQAGAPSLIHVGDASYLAVYAPLPGTQGGRQGFVTLRNYKTATSQFQHLYAALVTIFGLALILALAAGTGVARGLTRPLDGVIEAAQVIRTGAWPEPFTVNRTDEIGLLQSVFNEMTSSLRESRAQLIALIDSDPLTGLSNHRSFQERLVEEAARCTASGDRLTMLLVSIDHFQQYNQRHGHAAGDTALVRIAGILADVQGELTIPSRFAGDQFAVLLPEQPIEHARYYAEYLRDAIAREWTTPEGDREITVSIGVAEFGTHTKQADGLVLAAELALTRAKQLGRNLVCGFDSVPGADETADPYQLYRFMKDESLATIQALAAAVDAKDSYTRGHSQSVAQYATDLARYLGTSAADIELIHTTGTLHDVGKIGVPDAILKKPGRLTEEERTIMETHPVLGEVIVRKVPSLAATLPGVRHHHERWDGKGYPDRLAGPSIPRIARILAIADSFDAMTSDRPYRTARKRRRFSV